MALALQKVINPIARSASRAASLARSSKAVLSTAAIKPAAVKNLAGLAAMRSLATAAAAAKKPDMFCFQCEQTEHGTGCTVVGVCGKTPDVAALQDLLIHCLKGISMYATRAAKLGASDPEVNRFFLKAMFSTLTNVNFDGVAIAAYIQQAQGIRDKAKKLYESAAAKKGVAAEKLVGPAQFSVHSKTIEQLTEEGKNVGVLDRKAERGDDVVGLQEMICYGLKGVCAYAEHASMLGRESDEVYAGIHEAMAALTNPKPDVGETLALAMQVGQVNLKVIEMLEAGHLSKYGDPTPTTVSCNPVPGKCILVSGHDLTDLEEILKQTEGTGINVYTHGEMLPAHGYPGLKKYKHLAGHFGGPWQLQRVEFANFPGAIVMTSNCIIEPRKSYKSRIFTRQMVGWPGVTHLEGTDFSQVVKAAKEADGFTQDDVPAKPATMTTGFGKNAVLSNAGAIVDLVQKGKISHFFVIGGCDGSEGERNYFRELAIASPEDSVILTLGCGKYRINRLELGNLKGTGIPRVLDMGQCNDAYGAIQVAVALAKAFKTDVNGLPLSFAVSWFEQKAVAVFLTLLSLGVKNIRLGPNLPGFCTPNMLKILVDKFNIARIDSVKNDLPKMMKNQ